jgi:drug/metabolite transporter (DMT)-like permease
MRRHSTDLVGLIFGTAFAMAGVAFLVNEATDTAVNPAWATGLGLMLVGAVALIATVVRGPRDRDHDNEHFGYVEPEPEPEPVTADATTSDE